MRARSTGGIPKGWIYCLTDEKVKDFLQRVFPELPRLPTRPTRFVLVILVYLPPSWPSVSSIDAHTPFI